MDDSDTISVHFSEREIYEQLQVLGYYDVSNAHVLQLKRELDHLVDTGKLLEITSVSAVSRNASQHEMVPPALYGQSSNALSTSLATIDSADDSFSHRVVRGIHHDVQDARTHGQVYEGIQELPSRELCHHSTPNATSSRERMAPAITRKVSSGASRQYAATAQQTEGRKEDVGETRMRRKVSRSVRGRREVVQGSRDRSPPPPSGARTEEHMQAASDRLPMSLVELYRRLRFLSGELASAQRDAAPASCPHVRPGSEGEDCGLCFPPFSYGAYPAPKNPPDVPKRSFILAHPEGGVPPHKVAKCDPVARYHAYRHLWQAHGLEGGSAGRRDQLRWAVRTKLIDRDEVAKQNNVPPRM